MKMFLKNKIVILDIILIICGTFISSLGINLFISNARLLSGGATGIALIFEYAMNIPSGLIVFLINIPLFFISYKFLLTTILNGPITLSLFMQPFLQYEELNLTLLFIMLSYI